MPWQRFPWGARPRPVSRSPSRTSTSPTTNSTGWVDFLSRGGGLPGYQAYLLAQKDLDDARAVVDAKKMARDAALAGAVAMTAPLRKYLAGTYGEDSPTYKAFGLPVPRKPSKSVHVKADAATQGDGDSQAARGGSRRAARAHAARAEGVTLRG